MPWSRSWRRWKVLAGDRVMVVHGPAKGQTGVVKRVLRDEREPKVIVEGCNIKYRYVPGREGSKGARVQVEAPLPYASVNVLDPKTNLPVRVGYTFLEDGTKVRVGRGVGASGEVLPRAVRAPRERGPPGPKDTPVEEVRRVTALLGESLPSYIDPDTLEPTEPSRFVAAGAQPFKPWTFGFHPEWRPKNPRVSMQSAFASFRVPGWPSRYDFKGRMDEGRYNHPEGSPGFPVPSQPEAAKEVGARLRDIMEALPEGEERDAALRELPRDFAAYQRRMLDKRAFKDVLEGFAALGVDPKVAHGAEKMPEAKPRRIG